MDFPLSKNGTVCVNARSRAETDVPSSLFETLLRDLAGRWDRGERPHAEEYFTRHPELLEEPANAVELIYEEICLSEQSGQQGAWEDALRRFPRFGEQLQALWECHRVLQPIQPLPRFPACGETIGEFRLLKELGRGGQGRVFLAAQPALGNRPVVLKLTPRTGREHLALARLQHTNIVPLYAARDDSSRQLRLLCMPYLGDATLSQLLIELSAIPCTLRTGQDLVAALDRLQKAAPLPETPGIAPKQLLARASYVEAVCWIGACCADAIQYAHDRGLVHLDLKPSNTLIAADGQPMLLDFHLAHEPLLPGKPAPEEFGGTSAYMPPEQRAALDAVGEGRPIPGAVDGRADIYSLCAVLYEALGGRIPFEPGESPPLHRINPQVSVGLSDVIAKCLAANPTHRYPTAAALAGDLRRHLAHRPLQGIANRSRRERWHKYRQRRPAALRRMLLAALVAVLTLTLAAGGWFSLVERYHEAEHALIVGESQWRQQLAYGEAVATFEHGLARIDGLPFHGDLDRRLREQLVAVQGARENARRELLVRDLHQHVELLVMLLDLENVPTTRLRSLESRARELWANRVLIRERLGKLSDIGVDHDLLDLALALTSLNLRLAATSELPAAHRQALQILAEAEELLGPQAAVDQDRQLHMTALGQKEPAHFTSAARRTAWDHRMLGRSLMRAGQLELAAAELKQACDLEPANAWSNYYYGRCAYRLQRYEDAALAFSVCVGSAPHLAGVYYSRGLALTGLGRISEAIRDYDEALHLDPTLACALLNRGMLHYQQRRYDTALHDLRQALSQGADEALACYDLALVHVAKNEPASALACLERVLQRDADQPEALRLREQLRGQH